MTSTLDAVRNASALIREQAPACESAGRLSGEVIAAIREAGVFRMTMSRDLGGPELSPLEQVEVLEQLSAADGSAGWCGMINSDGGYMTSFLEPAVAKELYPSLDLATSVVGMPQGRAQVDGDGYVVNGRWAFASGSTHCDWFFLNCMVMEGDTHLLGDGDLPAMRMMAIPAAQVEVLDTWHTTGLNGTASNDVQVSEVRVPVERTFSHLVDDARDPSPLYQCRWMFFSNIAAVPLGVARAAIEEAKSVASTKLVMPSFTYARDDPTVQDAIGRAESLVATSRPTISTLSVGSGARFNADGRSALASGPPFGWPPRMRFSPARKPLSLCTRPSEPPAFIVAHPLTVRSGTSQRWPSTCSARRRRTPRADALCWGSSLASSLSDGLRRPPVWRSVTLA